MGEAERQLDWVQIAYPCKEERAKLDILVDQGEQVYEEKGSNKDRPIHGWIYR